jgi:hypoxanthine phosphoribosyltransferase
MLFDTSEDMIKIKLHQINDVAVRLAEQVRQDSFSPNAVIYLEKAGYMIGLAIADYLSCTEVIRCEARRPLTTTKKKGTNLFRYLPDWMISLLRIAEVNLKLYKTNKERHVQLHGEIDPQKRYLIVDDSLDTGYSLFELVSKLTLGGVPRDHIRVAVINILSEKKLQPVILPEYFLHKNVHIQYPWSADSADYERYCILYDEMKSVGSGDQYPR